MVERGLRSPEATVATYFSRLNGSDADGLSALFTDDGAFMGNGVPTASGRESIRSFAESAFAHATHTHTYDVDRVEVGDPVTVVMTHSTGVVRPHDGGGESTSSHRSAFVLRREGSEWFIAAYMYNGV